MKFIFVMRGDESVANMNIFRRFFLLEKKKKIEEKNKKMIIYLNFLFNKVK